MSELSYAMYNANNALNMNSQSCLGQCSPTQILTLNMPMNDPSKISIKDDNGCDYDVMSLQVSYSLDGVCWSCWMPMEDVIANTIGEISDMYVRIKVPGPISSVSNENGNDTEDYTTSLDSGFNLTSASYCDSNPNQYSPYANMDGALQLQQSLSDMVSCTVGIPIYYFKVDGIAESADLTFKEYALKSVRDYKKIKLIVKDGQMPSSKPEFADIALDWQTDWETEISKTAFATAFGETAQPMEGDLIYIPMMKRMWQVAEAYDERNGSLMWQSTTWQVFLTKYQSGPALDLNEHEDFVNELIANKYETVFGKEEPVDSGYKEAMNTQTVRKANLYPVFESDAVRKMMTCDYIDFQKTSLYHKGTLIMDQCYNYANAKSANNVISLDPTEALITYQKPWCGDELSVSFIFRALDNEEEHTANIISIGDRINLKITHGGIIKKTIKKIIYNEKVSLELNLDSNIRLDLKTNRWYFVTLRMSHSLRSSVITAAEYKYPESIPLYKLTTWHYYFDIDNQLQASSRWNEEMQSNNALEVKTQGFYGNISNIKTFNIYNDNISELMMQYPTNAQMLLNDTARPLVGILGV